MDNLWLKVENIVAKGEIARCHYVFKKLSAAEASESIYMRERVKLKWLFLFTETVIVHTCCQYVPLFRV